LKIDMTHAVPFKSFEVLCGDKNDI